MALIAYLVVWFASFVPLFMLPVQSGGWLLAGVVCCALSAFFGWALVSMQALSDNIGFMYYIWWAAAIVIAAFGSLGFIYCLASLIWRGAGIHIDVNVQDVRQ